MGDKLGENPAALCAAVFPLSSKNLSRVYTRPGTERVNVKVAWHLKNFTKVGGRTPSICLNLSIQIELDTLIMYIHKLEKVSPFSKYSPSKL